MPKNRADLATLLRRMQPGTLLLETNLARAPIVGARAGLGAESMQTWRPLNMYGQPFHVSSWIGPLAPRDLLLVAELCTKFVLEDGAAPEMSYAEAARALGLASAGGRTRQLASNSLQRIGAIRMESHVRESRTGLRKVSWGVLDDGSLAGHYPGEEVRLHPEIAQLLDGGMATVLDGGTFRSLISADDIAARLWLYLEAETKPWHLLLHDEQRVSTRSSTERKDPAIADLLRIEDRSMSRVAARVRSACEVIMSIDPRYILRLERANTRGNWRLEYGRDVQPIRHANPGTVMVGQGDRRVETMGTVVGGGGDSGVTGRTGLPGVPSYPLPSLSLPSDKSSGSGTNVPAASGGPGSDIPDNLAAEILTRTDWPRLTQKQRSKLSWVAKEMRRPWHDVSSGYAWLGDQVLMAPKGVDPIDFVLERLKRERRAKRVKLPIEVLDAWLARARPTAVGMLSDDQAVVLKRFVEHFGQDEVVDTLAGRRLSPSLGLYRLIEEDNRATSLSPAAQ